MEIHAQRVGVIGPHGPMLEPTTLRVPPGEAVLVAGPPGIAHTALALVLSGRMAPGTGTVTPSAAELRRHVVPVDSPGVTEPDGSLPLAAVVGEELAVNGVPSGRKAVTDWLVAHGAADHLATRYEQVPPPLRCALLLELAAGRPGARVLVLDSPDRYHDDPADWWERARSHVSADRSVVVLCSSTSAAALGVTAARIGADNTRPDDTGPNDTGPNDTDTAAGEGSA